MDLTPYIDEMNRLKAGIEGIEVLRHGARVAAHRWIPEAPRILYSASKSFTSMAVGIAVGDGCLSPDDRPIDAFPGVAAPDPRAASLTLRHLLTMSRGYDGFSMDATVAEVLAHPLAHDPGSTFVYDNASTFLASAMVTAATGKTVRDLMIERVFRPMGIPDPVWPASTDGHTIGGTGLELTTGDLAKFGQLLLRHGAWEGRQLIPAAWIAEATRLQIETQAARSSDDWNLGYGYQFWMCRHGAYRGDGMLGQYVIVMPEQDAVVAITSEEESMAPILYAVWDHILPQLSA